MRRCVAEAKKRTHRQLISSLITIIQTGLDKYSWPLTIKIRQEISRHGHLDARPDFVPAFSLQDAVLQIFEALAHEMRAATPKALESMHEKIRGIRITPLHGYINPSVGLKRYLNYKSSANSSLWLLHNTYTLG